MTDAPTRQFHPTKNDRLQSARAKRLGSYERRLKAAGLSQDDDVPKDKEEFYGQLARRIFMLINRWHGSCPEGICNRNRGCMAPNGICANAEQRTDEEVNRDWHKVKHKIFKAIKDTLAAQGLEVP